PAITADIEFEPLAERIDHRDANTVQTARDLVGVLVELTAGMELGHDDLGGRNALFLVDAGRDAATIVVDRHRTIGIERDGYQVGVTGQSLVNRVIDHLIDHVVQAGTIIGIADIHAGALAHGIEATQHLDAVGAIFFGNGIFAIG